MRKTRTQSKGPEAATPQQEGQIGGSATASQAKTTPDGRSDSGQNRSSATSKSLLIPKSLFAITIIVATLLVCWKFAYPLMFAGFQPYDDEGASLMTLDQLAHGHVLYNEVTTMYGPMGFLPKLAIVKLLHLTLDHDTGRLMALSLWLFMCLLIGLTVWRLSGSMLWFGLGAVCACMSLYPLIHEPGHPQDICGSILALAVLMAAMSGGASLTPVVALLGVFAGLLCMAKINLGAFLVAGVGMAMVCHMNLGKRRIGVLIAAAVVMAACPIALMHGDFDRGWPAYYAAEISVALVACFAAAVIVPSASRLKPMHFLWCGVAFLATVLTVSLICFAMGISSDGLINAVIFLPMRLAKSFLIPSPIDGHSLAFTLFGMVLAIGMSIWASRSRAQSKLMFACSGVLRICAAIFFLNYAYHTDGMFLFAYLPAGVWLLLLPVSPRNSGRGPHFFGRLMLAFVALFETMWAYPVYGSQSGFSQFLEMAIVVITLADGITTLTELMRDAVMAKVVRLTTAAAVLAISLFMGNRFGDFENAIYRYQIPLELPGAQMIHLPWQEVHTFELVSANINANADVFYTAPGLFSYNFWTQKPPPTSCNATGWMYVLTDDQQKQIADVLDSHPRACFLYSEPLVNFWMQGKPAPSCPLLDYVNRNFRRAYTVGGVQFWVRKDRKSVDVVDVTGNVTRLNWPPPKS